MIHLLKSANGREVTTKCGLPLKIPKDQATCEVATIWSSEVTCPTCKGENDVPI